jgi:hypothetical protein
MERGIAERADCVHPKQRKVSQDVIDVYFLYIEVEVVIEIQSGILSKPALSSA